jgi:hypothetical protein
VDAIKAVNKTKELIVLKETMFESMWADTWGYGTLGILFWFNYNYIGGSYVVNTIILGMIALKLGKMVSSYKTYTIDEAIQKLEALKEKDCE